MTSRKRDAVILLFCVALFLWVAIDMALTLGVATAAKVLAVVLLLFGGVLAFAFVFVKWWIK